LENVPIDDNCYCVFPIPKDYIQTHPSIKYTANFENYLYSKLKDKLCQSDIAQLVSEWIGRWVPSYRRDNGTIAKQHYLYKEN